MDVQWQRARVVVEDGKFGQLNGQLQGLTIRAFV